MRRIIVAVILSLSILAGCSPYDSPADAAPSAPSPPATSTTKPTAPACDQACIYAYAHAIEQARIHRIYAYAAAVERNRIARIYAFAAAVEQARLARLAASSYPSGQCGGSLPPCYVMMRESGGDPRAVSPTGKYRGKWQFDVRTFAGYGGYRYADQAPERIQDERARQVWAGGRGCSHWAAC